MFGRALSFMLAGVSAAIAADAPLKVSVAIPEAFNFSVSTKHYAKGQVIIAEPPEARMTALASFTEFSGCHGECSEEIDRGNGWTVRVYRGASQKAMAAYAKAKDGFEANLLEGPEFLGYGSAPQFFARFHRKRFSWGQAVSFLSQETQDAGLDVPYNPHLQYEVWGVTRDQQYTVVGSLSVSHPKLANRSSPDTVRSVPNLRALKKDKDYKLIETCSPDDFAPSLKAFDQLVDKVLFER